MLVTNFPPWGRFRHLQYFFGGTHKHSNPFTYFLYDVPRFGPTVYPSSSNTHSFTNYLHTLDTTNDYSFDARHIPSESSIAVALGKRRLGLVSHHPGSCWRFELTWTALRKSRPAFRIHNKGVGSEREGNDTQAESEGAHSHWSLFYSSLQLFLCTSLAVSSYAFAYLHPRIASILFYT